MIDSSSEVFSRPCRSGGSRRALVYLLGLVDHLLGVLPVLLDRLIYFFGLLPVLTTGSAWNTTSMTAAAAYY